MNNVGSIGSGKNKNPSLVIIHYSFVIKQRDRIIVHFFKYMSLCFRLFLFIFPYHTFYEKCKKNSLYAVCRIFGLFDHQYV